MSKTRSAKPSTDTFGLEVDALKRQLKAAAFDPELRAKARRLQQQIDARLGSDSDRKRVERLQSSHLDLRASNLVAEVGDYYGDITASRRAVRDGEAVLATLDGENLPTDYESRVLFRERVRYGLNYAQAHLYRAHRFEEARTTIERCERFVLDHLVRPDEPCFGTLAQINYYKGRACRQLFEWKTAEASFAAAIENHFLRAKLKNTPEEVAFARHRSAIALGLGLGLMNATRGKLHFALHYAIRPAQILLMEAGRGTVDVLNHAYMTMLEGTIQRALAGRTNPELLGEALKCLQRARDTFRAHGHDKYATRTTLDISLCYLYGGRLAEAEREILKVEERAKETNHSRWHSRALIVLSRIARAARNLPEAERLAAEALRISRALREPADAVGVTESLIARGEARVSRQRLEEARQDFSEALARASGTSDPKTRAVCELQLARTYLRSAPARVREHLQHWKELRHEVDHKIVHEMAAEIEEALDQITGDFVIRADADMLDYKVHVEALQKFLVSAARRDTHTQEQVAEKLKVSRQTLILWNKKDTSKKSAGASNTPGKQARSSTLRSSRSAKAKTPKPA